MTSGFRHDVVSEARRHTCDMYDIVCETYDVVPSKHTTSYTSDIVCLGHDVISFKMTMSCMLYTMLYWYIFLYVRHLVLGHDVVSSDTMSCPKNTMSWVYDVATLWRRVFVIWHRNMVLAANLADIIYDIEFLILRRDIWPTFCKIPYVVLPLVDQPKSRCRRWRPTRSGCPKPRRHIKIK